jgi:hypothetical protein
MCAHGGKRAGAIPHAAGVGGGCSVIGQLWQRLYVDGSEAALSWDSLPFGRWGHVHLEAGYVFQDNLNVMSRQVSFLSG